MEDARVHCVVLKVRAVPFPHATTVTPEKALEEQPPTTTSLPTSAISARPLRTQQRACTHPS